MRPLPALASQLLQQQSGVARYQQVLGAGCSRALIRHRVDSGRWRLVLPDVLAAFTGPLPRDAELWAASLWAGEEAALTGHAAAALDGLRGFGSEQVHVLISPNRRLRVPSGYEPGLAGRLTVTRSRSLAGVHVRASHRPRRTTIERSVLEIAQERRTADGAFAVVAASVQQRLTTPARIRAVLDDLWQLRHKAVIRDALADIDGGQHALSEHRLSRALRRAGLPQPDRQEVVLLNGKRAYLDGYYDELRVVLEVDGAGHLLLDRAIADTDRDTELQARGHLVVRILNVQLYADERAAMAKVRRALTARGWAP